MLISSENISESLKQYWILSIKYQEKTFDFWSVDSLISGDTLTLSSKQLSNIWALILREEGEVWFLILPSARILKRRVPFDRPLAQHNPFDWCFGTGVNLLHNQYISVWSIITIFWTMNSLYKCKFDKWQTF